MHQGRLGLSQWGRVPVLLLLVMSVSQPAFAQVDISGLWRPLARNQDGSGMTGDSAGLPLSSEGQSRSQSWSPEDFDIAEWVCRPHSFDYSLEGPLSALRLWTEQDRPTQKIDRVPRAPQHDGAGNLHLDGWPPPSSGECPAHVEWFFDRGVGRRRAGRHDDPPQGSVHAADGRDAQRSGDGAHAVASHGELSASDFDSVRPRPHAGTVRAKHDDVGLRPRSRRGALSVRGSHRDRRYRGATRRTFCRARARCQA